MAFSEVYRFSVLGSRDGIKTLRFLGKHTLLGSRPRVCKEREHGGYKLAEMDCEKRLEENPMP